MNEGYVNLKKSYDYAKLSYASIVRAKWDSYSKSSQTEL